MNGPHDLGGRHGFGPVAPEADEPVFHEPWESRMFGIAYCILTSGCNTIDETRHAMEKMPHAAYLSTSYYEHWLYAYERILHEKGLCTHEEVARREAELGGASERGRATGEPSDLRRRVLEVLRHGRPHDVPAATAPAFEVGRRIRARNSHTKRHLRLPGYAKGREGVVVAYRGHLDHPEARAHGEPDTGGHCYSVAFLAAELWGASAERPDDVIHLDLLEEYLEPVSA